MKYRNSVDQVTAVTAHLSRRPGSRRGIASFRIRACPSSRPGGWSPRWRDRSICSGSVQWERLREVLKLHDVSSAVLTHLRRRAVSSLSKDSADPRRFETRDQASQVQRGATGRTGRPMFRSLLEAPSHREGHQERTRRGRRSNTLKTESRLCEKCCPLRLRTLGASARVEHPEVHQLRA